MMKAAIIEKELSCAEYLKLLLLKWADKKTDLNISVFLNGDDFFHGKNSDILEFDIVFIELELKSIDGIAAAGKLRNMGFRNTIVLVADAAGGAIDGYKVNAYRYYLKPVQSCDIAECMDYVLNKNTSDYFCYTYHGVTSRLAFEDIICFESMQHYIDIFTIEKTIRIKGALKEILKQCPPCFIRCQRSYIVNSHYIREKQGNQLKLVNRKIIDVSPKYMEAILEVLT